MFYCYLLSFSWSIIDSWLKMRQVDKLREFGLEFAGLILQKIRIEELRGLIFFYMSGNFLIFCPCLIK